MIVETNEYKLLALVAAHVAALLVVAWCVSALTGLDFTPLACVLAILGIRNGVVHTTRILRGELKKAHGALSEAVVIVTRTQGLALPPEQWSKKIQECVTQRLAGFPFWFVTVRFGVPKS